MSIKLVIGLIVVIALSSDYSSVPVSGFEFKTCDGYDGPVWPIKIDACPDPSSVDACEFKGNNVEVTAEFTPPHDSDEVSIGLSFEGGYSTYNMCTAAGVKCPAKAGAKQEVQQRMVVPSTRMQAPKRSASVKLFMFNEDMHHSWYCIEFPALY